MGVSPVFLHLKGEQIMAKSKKEKKYFYVGVQTDKGMQFVTKDDYSTRTSYWEPSDKPMTWPTISLLACRGMDMRLLSWSLSTN